MGEDKNPWDRSWSVEEMRDGANNWSLASDAGMLQHLQEFSQRMIARTHEIQQQVNGLVHETKLSSIRVNSAFNDFIMLANTQFVENRVYDEDVAQEHTDREKSEEKEKTKEEREAELIPKITQAVRLGLSVIDTAFEKLDMNQGDSESDDEQQYSAEPLLEAKDPYIHRALPYIIGSQAFMQDDDVGLVDMLSEDEEEQVVESESDRSESETESETEEAPQQRKQLAKFDSESDSDSDGDLFGEKKKFSDDEELTESDQDGGQSSESEHELAPQIAETVPATAKDFASELASKLGLPGQTVTKQPEPTTESVPTKKGDQEKKHKKHKAQKVQQRKHSDDDDADLFSAPIRDDIFAEEDDDSAFGAGGGLFSTGKKVTSLFDDDDEGGLFDAEPIASKPAVKQRQPAVEPQQANKPSPVPSPKITKSGKKVPAGGVSIFGDDGDDLFSASSAPSKKPATSLFDEDDDVYESSSSVLKSPHPTASKSKVSSLFDNESSETESEEEDLFADKPKPKVVQATKTKPKLDENESKSPEQSKKKLPPGAVSMFGNAPNPLMAAMKGKQKPVESESEDSDWSGDEQQTSKHIPPPEPGTRPAVNQRPVNKKPAQSDSMNNLFAHESEIKKSSPPTEDQGLFDDDDDLFSVVPQKTKSVSKVETTKPSTPQVAMQVGAPQLFSGQESDSDDDLFQTVIKSKQMDGKSSRGNTLAFDDDDEAELFSTQTSTDTSSKKKPVGGVALFGGADLFATQRQGVPKKISEPKSAESPKVQPKQASKPQLQAKKTISLFDADSEEEDLFATAPAQTKQAVKPENVKQSSGLFDDTDDLFSVQSTKAPEADIFGSTSPLKTQPLPKIAVKAKSEPAESRQQLEEKPQVSIETTTQSLGGVTSTASTTDHDDIFNQEQASPPVARQKKPPAGAVSMFGGLDPSVLLKKKPQNEKTVEERQETAQPKQAVSDPLFGSAEDDGDLFSAKPSKPKPPKLTPKPKPSATLITPDKDDLFSAKPSSTGSSTERVTSASTSVGKIKSNLVFNPATMVPGATPPVKEHEVVAVSFDEPVSAKTLTSVVKDRAKIQRNRRPPSRKNRTTTADQSALDVSTVSLDQSPFSISGSSVPETVTDTSPPQARTRDLFGNDDLFGDIKITNQTQSPVLSKQQTVTSEMKTPDKNDSLLEKDDEIFSAPVGTKTKPSQNNDSSTVSEIDGQKVADVKTKETTDKVSSWLQKNEPVTQPSSKSVFEEDDEDIFASSVTSKSTPPPAKSDWSKDLSIRSEDPPTKTKTASKTPVLSQEPPPLKISSVEGNEDSEDENLFADAKSDFEDDLFSRKKPDPVKENLQGENATDDDLFSFSKTTTKTKTTFDNDEDIFASSSVLSKAKPKSTPKENADDIFNVTTEPVAISKRDDLKPEIDDIFGSGAKQHTRNPPDVDDIFGAVTVAASKQAEMKPKVESSVKSGSKQAAVADDGDIFGDVPTPSKPAPATVVKPTDDDIFGDVKTKVVVTKTTAPADEDIFADVPKSKTKSAKKAKKAVVKDEDIFEDDTDIFADIPAAKPKEKKSKKKAVSSKPIFSNNDVDDIFATATSSKTKAKKATKKESKPDATDDSAHNIFDDPLSALQ